MQGQKTLSLSYNMHLFLPYLLNNSQTIRSKINISKPLLCVMLICECSAPLYTVLPGKQLFLPLQKRHLVAKNEFAFSFRPMQKSSFPKSAHAQQVGGQYANVSC